MSRETCGFQPSAVSPAIEEVPQGDKPINAVRRLVDGLPPAGEVALPNRHGKEALRTTWGK